MLNRKNISLTSLLLISISLVGCGEEKLRTYDFYKENPKEVEKILKKCDAESEKGYKPEGNFGENCSTARKVKMNNTLGAIRNAIQ